MPEIGTESSRRIRCPRQTSGWGYRPLNYGESQYGNSVFEPLELRTVFLSERDFPAEIRIKGHPEVPALLLVSAEK